MLGWLWLRNLFFVLADGQTGNTVNERLIIIDPRILFLFHTVVFSKSIARSQRVLWIASVLHKKLLWRHPFYKTTTCYLPFEWYFDFTIFLVVWFDFYFLSQKRLRLPSANCRCRRKTQFGITMTARTKVRKFRCHIWAKVRSWLSPSFRDLMVAWIADSVTKVNEETLLDKNNKIALSEN